MWASCNVAIGQILHDSHELLHQVEVDALLLVPSRPLLIHRRQLLHQTDVLPLQRVQLVFSLVK